MDPHNIDLDRVAQLLDIVQKQASVAPQYMAISSIAMMEVKEINEEAQQYLNDLGQERLKAEQEAAAELNRRNQLAAEQHERDNAEIAKRTAASRTQPITVMPGEPVPNVVREQAGEISQETDVPQFPDDEPTPVARRV